MTTTATRREALKQTAVVGAVAGSSLPVMTRMVAATASGDPELTIRGTIPDGTDIGAMVSEYDTDSSTPLTTQTETITTSGSPTPFGEIAGQTDYDYGFEFTLNGGSATPEVTGLLFEIPKNLESSDYTAQLDWRAKPESVAISFDEGYLKRHQPMLMMAPTTREQNKGIYGYVAKSPDRDTDALCYWSQLTHQNGLPFVNSDSHLGDHEPIYVFVNSDDGSVEEIVYSAYHWFAGSEEITTPATQLASSRANEPTHPVLSVSEQWHNYSYDADASGAFTTLKSWPEVRSSWVNNGFFNPANVAAIENPWKMRDLSGWWEQGSIDGMVAGVYAEIGSTLGWYGAEQADSWR